MEDLNQDDNKKQDANIEEKIQELENKAAEYLAGWQRAKADFANYRKDEEKNIAKMHRLTKIAVMKKILPIIDSLEESKKHKNPELEAIASQLMNILKREGLEEIDALGKNFDPQFHESIGFVEREGEENEVAEQLRKGYIVEGEVIRPALVKISIKK